MSNKLVPKAWVVLKVHFPIPKNNQLIDDFISSLVQNKLNRNLIIEGASDVPSNFSFDSKLSITYKISDNADKLKELLLKGIVSFTPAVGSLAINGQFVLLEQWLRTNQIPFDRYTFSNVMVDPEICYFRIIKKKPVYSRIPVSPSKLLIANLSSKTPIQTYAYDPQLYNNLDGLIKAYYKGSLTAEETIENIKDVLPTVIPEL